MLNINYKKRLTLFIQCDF